MYIAEVHHRAVKEAEDTVKYKYKDMGVVIIIVGIMFIIAHKNKGKKKKNRTTWHGKSDWERECDDGGKFFGW